MWKSVAGWLLILVSLFLFYEAWTYWDQLTKWASFVVGAASGGCLTAGLVILLWRPNHPATRYSSDESQVPSPWNRNRWL